MPEYSVLGKRLPRVDALDKATGKALYSADISLPNMLYGKVLRSTYAHATICRLDTSKAKALKGVKAVITAADVSEDKKKEISIIPLLAKEKVVFAGQPIAAVAATSRYIAEDALRLIEVDYEELPPVMDAVEAMNPDAPLIHQDLFTNLLLQGQMSKAAVPSNIAWHWELGNGDVEAGFKEADIVLENTFRVQRVHQGYLEPRAAVANIDSEGKATIWSDSQGTFEVQEVCANFLNVPVSHVKVMPVEVGGAFGGKQIHPLSPLCAFLSRKTGRPVKMVMTREEDFTATNPAPILSITLKVGATMEGKLTAILATLICDMGAFPKEWITSIGGGISGLSLYRVPNTSIKCYDVITNKSPTGPYRAPDASETAFAVESQMDLLARALKMDPLDLRLINAVVEGDHSADGSPFRRIGFKETLQKMKEYVSPRNKSVGNNRGIGVACGFWQGGGGVCGADINIGGDGSVTLIIGSCDLTGTRTALAQIVAEELGIPFNKVTVITGDTNTAPFSDVAAGSRTTRQMGTAVYNACQDARDQLAQDAAVLLQAELTDLKFINGQVHVVGKPEKSIPLATLARNRINRGGKGPIIGRGIVGERQSPPMFAVHCSEVEVDPDTGKVKVLSYAAAQDVGFAINPTLLEGQMQGAASQGIGRALMEEYVMHQGIMQNPNFLDYHTPTAVDIPFIHTMLVEVPSDIAPFGVRGAGEASMVPTLATIANAVHNAAGVRLKELPMTPESVLRAMRSQGKPFRKK